MKMTLLRAGDAVLTVLCAGMTFWEIFHSPADGTHGRNVLILAWALSGVFCLASFRWSWADRLADQGRKWLMALGIRSALR